MTIKERRKALGWSRAQLAAKSGIDKSVLQLIELEQYSHEEMVDKVVAALEAAEAELPN